MSALIPASDALNVDALYLDSILDSLYLAAARLRHIRDAKRQNLPVDAQQFQATRIHLSDLAEQFELFAGGKELPFEADQPVFADAALAPARSP